jgi:hypothetical protein
MASIDPRWRLSVGGPHVITSIELQQLRCTFQPRPHSSRPYLWGVLLQVDDDTLASGALVATVSFPPAPDGSFSEIAAAMHDGDSATIPGRWPGTQHVSGPVRPTTT